MEVTTLKRTCIACPSQWEGHLKDGRMFYGRYRWGWLTIEVSENPTQDVMDAVGGNLLLEQEIGGGFDGDMSNEDFIEKMLSVGFNFDKYER